MGRAGWDDACNPPHELPTALGIARVQLGLVFPESAREDADRLHLRVGDADHLAAHAPDLDRAQRHLLDDAFERERLDDDRVSHPKPAFEEHEQAGDDIGQEALEREGECDGEKRRPDDCLDPLRAGQGHDREQQSHAEDQIGEGRLDERNGRFALLEARDHARVDVVGAESAPSFAPIDEEGGEAAAESGEDESDEKEPGDDDKLAEWRIDRSSLGEEVGEPVHEGAKLAAVPADPQASLTDL